MARGGSPDDSGAPLWHFLCLAELHDFASLRRRLGRTRTDRLTTVLAARVEAAHPDARVSTVGRTAIEFSFDGATFADLGPALRAIEHGMTKPIAVDGEECQVAVALAGAAMPFAALDDVRLVEEVESALALARAERRIVARDVLAEAPSFDPLTLKRDLTYALERGEMLLHYQPKVHVRRQEVTSVEALIRWQHPDRGLIPPGDFISLAEEARQIAAMTLWSLDQVQRDQAKLREHGFELTVFVNISGQLLGDTQFVEEACRKLEEADCRIGFEITETSVINDPDTAITHLRRFAEIGIPIAIDDYGAGLSSLVYLKKLPACELKIDKIFITQLTSSNRDPLIVRSTIDLAHALEMEVTAEGVESQAALALLTVMGCDMVQGFLISRPIGIDALLRFLAESHDLDVARSPENAFNRPASFWKRV